MGNENGRLRLRAQTVFSAVLEGKKTFAELAPKYGYTLEAFEAEVRAKVGPKEFERLKTESDRNADVRRKTEEKAAAEGGASMKEARTTKKSTTEAIHATTNAAVHVTAATPAATNTATPATATSATTSRRGEKKVVARDTLQRKLEDAQREAGVAAENAAAEATLLEVERGNVAEAEKKVASAKVALAKAESVLKEARKAFKKQESQVAEKQKAHKAWLECLANINQDIQELDAQLIYLVAPGYKGELPAVGKLISVVPFEGATIEIATIDGRDELYKDVTAMDLLASGFEMITEAGRAYDFARLVIKYEIQDIEVTVLVDDERIKKILRTQEVGF